MDRTLVFQTLSISTSGMLTIDTNCTISLSTKHLFLDESDPWLEIMTVWGIPPHLLYCISAWAQSATIPPLTPSAPAACIQPLQGRGVQPPGNTAWCWCPTATPQQLKTDVSVHQLSMISWRCVKSNKSYLIEMPLHLISSSPWQKHWSSYQVLGSHLQIRSWDGCQNTI